MLRMMCDFICLYTFFADNKGTPSKRHTILLDIPPIKSELLSFIRSQRGAPFLVQSGFVYRCERHNGPRTYWLCTKYKTVKCNGRLICQGNEIVKATQHNHVRDSSRMDRTVIEYYNMAGPNVDEFLNSYKK